MPEEKIPNTYPMATAAEFYAAPGGREQKAARCIAARRFAGIPTRGFLLGGNDHSPVMQGILDFTTEVYTLLDCLETFGVSEEGAETTETAARRVREIMEDHRCPTSPES